MTTLKLHVVTTIHYIISNAQSAHVKDQALRIAE